MSDVDDVKSRLNIIDVIGQRVTLKKAGRNFKGLCPFHNEKTPSFTASSDRQVFHCFGCGKGGSVIDFYMEYFHVDFVEALEELAKQAGVTLTRQGGETEVQKVKKKIFEINQLASEYYHYLLTKHALGEKARQYLAGRGVSDKSMKTFGLGYSPNSWDALSNFLRKKGYDNKIIEISGLAIHGSNGIYDRFRGRVIFTLRDHRGNVVGFSGRVLDPKIKEAKYINTSETPVYIKSNVLFALDVTKDAISKANEAIIMEGELDVISSFQAGIANVVAIKGSALTEGHVNLLKRFTERVIFALDSDLAGDAASRRGIEIADTAGLDMRVASIPLGKDPDEAAREDPILFKKSIKEAVPVYDYFITSAVKRFDMTSAFGKRKASDELMPIISRITNPIVQAHYVKKTASALDVSDETVIEGIKHVKQPLGSVASQDDKQEKPERSGEEKLEFYILSLLLQGETDVWLKEFHNFCQDTDFSSRDVGRIIQALTQFLTTNTVPQQELVAAFIKTVPNELISLIDEAYLIDLSSVSNEKESFQTEWNRTLRKLRKQILKRKMEMLKTDETHEDELAALTREYLALEKSS